MGEGDNGDGGDGGDGGESSVHHCTTPATALCRVTGIMSMQVRFLLGSS